MESLDLSLILSSAVSIVAVVTSLAATFLNNHHQYKIRKLELRAQYEEKSMELKYEKKASTFHSFFHYAADVMVHPDSSESYDKFIESYSQTLMYCSDDAMQSLNYFYECVSAIHNSDDKSQSQTILSGHLVSCAYNLRDCISPDSSIDRICKSRD